MNAAFIIEPTAFLVPASGTTMFREATSSKEIMSAPYRPPARTFPQPNGEPPLHVQRDADECDHGCFHCSGPETD
jgi:hypothetical protein